LEDFQKLDELISSLAPINSLDKKEIINFQIINNMRDEAIKIKNHNNTIFDFLENLKNKLILMENRHDFEIQNLKIQNENLKTLHQNDINNLKTQHQNDNNNMKTQHQNEKRN